MEENQLEEQVQAEVGNEAHQQLDETVKEDDAAAAAAAAAAIAQASNPMELGQLARLEIPQLLDYSAVANGQPNLMPAITTLIGQITQHLSNPNGNHQLALTFQPLVNAALQMHFQATVPDMSMMSAMYNLSALTTGMGGVPPNLVPFDPQVLMAAAAQATSDAEAVPADSEQQQQHEQQQQQQPQQQQRRQGGGGGRKQQQQEQHAKPESESDDEEEEGPVDDEDDEDWSYKRNKGGRHSSSAARPQRARKKSKLLAAYLTDEDGDV